MSKRFTYLFAGLVALSATLPVQVAAQSARQKKSKQIVQELHTSTNFSNTSVPSKALFAKANGLKTSRIASKNVYDVPYLEEFNDESSFNDFTVIDANHDSYTWTYDKGYDPAVRYHWSTTNTADDWIITPGIRLIAGKSYNVGFKARANSITYKERLEAKWGQDTTVAALTNMLLPSTDLSSYDYVVFNQKVSPAADGTYYFGFHAISDPYMFYLYLDSISVTELADDAEPDSVTNLKAIADPTGALKVSLSFNAPAKRIDGSALSAIDSIVIQKDGATIKNFSNPTPGAPYTYEDNDAVAGANVYTIAAANDKGNGRPAQVTAVAGPDIPTSPKVTAQDNLSNIKFTWPDVTGANGGVIIPSEVSYEIWSTAPSQYGITLADSITTINGVNEYTLNESTIEGNQDVKYWAFNAKNASGASQYSYVPVIVGTPYSLPFSESFASGTLERKFFGVSGGSAYPTWSLTADDSADNDGGAAVFYNEMTYYDHSLGGFSGQASLYTGKISLQGAQNPELIFSYNGTLSTNARLVAEVEHYDRTIDSLWSESFTNGTDEWKTVTVKLPTTVASEPYVFIHFRGIANDANAQKILVDNIHVASPYQNDAAVSVTAPGRRIKGQEANIVAKVSNQGNDPLSGLEVKISINDEVIKDTTLADPLARFDQVEIPVSYKTSSLQDVSSLNVKAEVINAGDYDDSNNTATASIALTQTNYNPPTNLQGTETADSVNLSWDVPETPTEAATDDFESYDAWATSNVGDWTFINADGAPFGSLTNDGSEPNAQAYAAYEVWRPGDVFGDNQALSTHSGNQCLASVYKLNYTTEQYVNSDDWLISPRLTGAAQTISFWVNNVKGDGFGTEKFQVLASSTDKDIESFTQIGDTIAQGNATWTNITVDLPAGSKYFAIHRVTDADNALVFLVDDITYISGATASSYNIYIDGEYAGNTIETSFSFESDGADHTYSVTAVYSDGSESEPATIDIVANSIDDIHAQFKADKYDVYTIGGAQVKLGAKSLNGLTPGVYVINGKKVILK